MGGALLGLGWVAALGVLCYVAGLALWGRSLIGPLRARPPREFGSATVLAGMIWWLAGLVWAAWLLVADDWTGRP